MTRSRPRPASSCRDCLAWGLLTASRCRACMGFHRRHPVGSCNRCGRVAPVKEEHCRLCWQQASAQAKLTGRAPGAATVLAPFLADVRHHQLFLADLQRRWSKRDPRGRRADRARAITSARPRAPARSPTIGCAQGTLFEARRRFTGPARARPDDPWLTWSLHVAGQLGEAHGWTPVINERVRQALAICLAEYCEGEVIRYSQLSPALQAKR